MTMENGNKVDQALNDVVNNALKAAGINLADVQQPPQGTPPVAPATTTTPPTTPATPTQDVSQKAKKNLTHRVPEAPAPTATPASSEKTPEGDKAPEDGKVSLSKADIDAMLTDVSRRFQSTIDRRLAQVEAKTTAVMNSLTQMSAKQEEIELAALPEEERLKKEVQILKERVNNPKPQPSPGQTLGDAASQPNVMTQIAVALDILGIKVDDKRLDWALDTNDYATGMARLQTSIRNIVNADKQDVAKRAKEALDVELAKVRKELKLDKVNHSGPSGSDNVDTSKLSPLEKISYGLRQREAQMGTDL